jgi:hypothetical protein
MENIISRIRMTIILERAFVDTIAEQPEFESKHCHLLIKIRLISLILCEIFLKESKL